MTNFLVIKNKSLFIVLFLKTHLPKTDIHILYTWSLLKHWWWWRQRQWQKSNRFRLAEQQLCTCIMLFLYIPYPSSLHKYKVTVSNFTFCQGWENMTTTFFLFSWLWYRSLEFNSKNVWQLLMNWTRLSKGDKVWGSKSSRRFHGRCCCRCFSFVVCMRRQQMTCSRYIICAFYNLCQTFLLSLQKFQKIDEEHLKVIIGYLEKYIESQKKGQVLVEGVIIFVVNYISVCWC